jgi:Ca2+-binding EF-hand superfamily protein
LAKVSGGNNLESLFCQVTQADTINSVIDRVILKKFLVLMSYQPNDNLINAIVRRIDVDGNAKVDFDEFTDMFKPLTN